MLSQSIIEFAVTARRLRQVDNQMSFNKYGMVNGHIETISPDAGELLDTRERDRKNTSEHFMPHAGFRTVMEYQLTPVQKVTHEAGREM